MLSFVNTAIKWEGRDGSVCETPRGNWDPGELVSQRSVGLAVGEQMEKQSHGMKSKRPSRFQGGPDYHHADDDIQQRIETQCSL